jgi:hypothetical protein
MSNSHKKEASVELLIAEFNAIQSHIIKIEEAKSNRVNFLLIVVAAVAVGVSGLVGNSNFQIFLSLILAVTAFGLLILGIAILNQLIRYSQAIVSLYRRAGHIRRWFAGYDAEITPYLPFEASDDRPLMNISSAYLEFRGDVIVLTLNTAFFSIFVIASTSSLFSLSGLIAVPLAIGSTLLIWFFRRIVYAQDSRKSSKVCRKIFAFHIKKLEL